MRVCGLIEPVELDGGMRGILLGSTGCYEDRDSRSEELGQMGGGLATGAGDEDSHNVSGR